MEGASDTKGTFFGGAVNAAGTILHGTTAAVGAAGQAASAAVNTTGKISGSAAAAVASTAENIAAAGYGATANVAGTGVRAVHAVDRRVLKTANTIGRRYGNAVSPIVQDQGADFGDDGNPEDTYVMLRMEVATSVEAKRAQAFSVIVTLFAVMATVALIVLKFNGPSVNDSKDAYFTASVVLASIFLGVMLISLFYFLSRIIKARRSQRVWSRRRRYIAASSFAILVFQIINVALWLAGNAFVLPTFCGWRSKTVALLGYLQWSCWNTEFLLLVVLAHNGSLWRGKIASAADGADEAVEEGRKFAKEKDSTALVLDAPISVHVLKFIFWVIFQLVITFFLVLSWSKLSSKLCAYESAFGCPATKTTIVCISLMIVIVAIYISAHAYYSWRTNNDIKSRPYAEMRFARMVFGFFQAQILPVFVTLGICAILLLCIQIGSCWTYVETWMGVIPLHAEATCMACTLCYFFMPQKAGSKDEILAAWLQEFAWTSSSLPAAIAERNRKLEDSVSLRNEPMFCMETAIKLLYFSIIVYGCEETKEAEADRAAGRLPSRNKVGGGEGGSQGDPPVKAGAGSKESSPATEATLGASELGAGLEESDPQLGLGDMQVALGLYDLDDWEVVWEKETDTKALLAWGESTVVVAFKGTSSRENIITDMNFFKMTHPPMRFAAMSEAWGTNLIKVLVRVHRGFYQAWSGLDFDKRIISRVGEILGSMKDPSAAKVYVTGHSLGGALATLGAHALRVAYSDQPLCVYTYGQPRVGNNAFAHEYNELVPEHFAVINDQDPVTRIPKASYKRVGNRILVNGLGDIAVRPTYLEMQIINHAAAGEVKDHYLEAYRASIIQVIHSQFTQRQLRNGKPGASALAREVDLNMALMAVNMELESLEDPTLEPTTQEEHRRIMKKTVKRQRSFTCGPSSTGCGCGGGGRRRQSGSEHAEDHHDERIVKLDSLKDEIPGSVSKK